MSRRFLFPLPSRFLGFFFGILVSAESSRGLVLDSDVDSTSRAGVVGVVGGTFVAGVVSLSCAGISDNYLTIDSKCLIWYRRRCRSCSLSAAVGGDLRFWSGLMCLGVVVCWRCLHLLVARTPKT